MTWSIGKKIGSGFALALVILTVVAAVSYNSMTKLIDSAELVQHTHQALTGLDRALSGIQAAEAGQRGYVITGEARYLEPYQGARDAVDQELKHLRELTSDNPKEQEQLAALDPLIAGRFAELQKIIDLRKEQGFGPAAQEVLTDKGRSTMDSIRKLVGEMEDEEDGLRIKR